MTITSEGIHTDVHKGVQPTPGEQRIQVSDLGRGVDSLFSDFKKSIESLMQPFFPTDFSSHVSDWRVFHYAPLDLIDEGDCFVVQVKLPGLSKENVEVTLDNLHLSVKGEKKEENGRNYLHRERLYSFRRSVSFPEEVDPDAAVASLNMGILGIRIPKWIQDPKRECGGWRSPNAYC